MKTKYFAIMLLAIGNHNTFQAGKLGTTIKFTSAAVVFVYSISVTQRYVEKPFTVQHIVEDDARNVKLFALAQIEQLESLQKRALHEIHHEAVNVSKELEKAADEIEKETDKEADKFDTEVKIEEKKESNTCSSWWSKP